MAVLTTLMMVKAGADMLQGLQTMQGGKKQAKYQKQILERRKEFNLKQINEAFDLGYKNIMRNYAEARQDQIEQATQGIKDTNTQISASARNVSLTESSFKGDIDAEMDFSLLENVNSMLQSQDNDTNTLLRKNYADKFQANQQYQDSLANINSTEQQMQQVGFSQLLSGSMAMYQGLEQRSADIKAIEGSDTNKSQVSQGIKYIREFGGPINPISRIGTSTEIKSRSGVFERMGEEWLK